MSVYVSSIFNLFVVLTSTFLFGAGMHWTATHQLGELDIILLLTTFLLAGVVLAHKLVVADFEPLSIT
jgi:hypothetical protein